VNWDHIRIVYRKELMDMLRDRRTIFGMILFPLIIFPLLTVGFGTVEKKSRERVRQEVHAIMILGEENAPALAARIRGSSSFRVGSPAADYAQRIDRKELRAAIEFPPGFEKELGSSGQPKVAIYFFEADIRSDSAADKLEEILRDYRKEVVEVRATSAGIPSVALRPIATERKNVAAPEKVAGSRLAIFLPYMIIVLCLSGAMHPAMDLTAGEKERGTMETLLASAAGRRELVVGKFLLVLTVSLITAVMSLTSYFGTMFFAKDYARDLTEGMSYSIHPMTVLTIFSMVLPLAIFFSATLMAMAVAAKNYKEAQQSIGSLMIFAFLPAIVGMIPGVELSPKLALVPILNVSLVAREVLTGSFPWGLIALSFAATCAFAGIALAAAVSRFQNESVLFRT
jgi:sodium transport system permease protein